MNISTLTSIPYLSQIIGTRCKHCRAICTSVLLLMFTGAVQAVPFGAGIAIENEMDSNGNITVVNGSKVYVAYEIEDPDKVSNKADKIQLLRVVDDSVVSSVERGKRKSGRVSLKVRHSEGEALYVRYLRKGKHGEEISRISYPDDPDYIPLLSIARVSFAELTVRVNAVETAPAVAAETTFSSFYEDFIPPTSSQCAEWKKFRQNLQPERYSCVQLSSSHGRGVTECSGAASGIAAALKEGSGLTFISPGSVWATVDRVEEGFDVWVGAQTPSDNSAVGLPFNSCDKLTGMSLFRPCVKNGNWGDVSGSDTSCGDGDIYVGIHPRASPQTISLTFR